MVTIGIDSGSKQCGVAIFQDGYLQKTIGLSFDGTFTLEKFKAIIQSFDNIFMEYAPDEVILEEPLAVRNGKVTRMLNQIAGGIFALAILYEAKLNTIHNKTLKRLSKITTKEDSINKVFELYGITCATPDESDAVLVVKSFYDSRQETRSNNRKNRTHNKRSRRSSKGKR